MLQSYPELRDDKNATVAAIWMRELEKLKISGTMEILKAIAEKKLSPADSICRNWRAVQKDNPQLRGKDYNKRHGMEKEVAREMMQPVTLVSHD